MLRLTPTDPSIVLTDAQVTRIRSLLLEFIPATSCLVEVGPRSQVTVPNHGLDELAPAIRSDIEATIGCAVLAEELPD